MTTQALTAALVIAQYGATNKVKITISHCIGLSHVVVAAITSAQASKSDPVLAATDAITGFAAAQEFTLTHEQATNLATAIVNTPDAAGSL